MSMIAAMMTSHPEKTSMLNVKESGLNAAGVYLMTHPM